MNNHEFYRTAFQMHAPEQAVERAVAHTQVRTNPRRRLRPGPLLAAAVITSLLVTTVSAEMSSGAVTNLLAPVFGSARTELLEGVGHPINASVSADGYTLTADAVIGDQHNLVIAYSFVRDGGQPIPENDGFEGGGSSALTSQGGSCHIICKRDPDDPSRMVIYEHYTISGHIPRMVQVGQYNLIQRGTDGMGDISIAEGPWNLSLTLRYPDTTTTIPAEDLSFSDDTGLVWELDTFSFSDLGFFLSGTTSGNVPGAPRLSHLSASATLKDGTVIPIRLSNLAYPGKPADYVGPFQVSAHGFYGESYDDMLLFSTHEVDYFTICGTTIPVQ